MKTETIVRKSLAIVAVAALAAPLATFAGVTLPDGAQSTRAETLLYARDGQVIAGAEELYARIKDKSREICGTSNVRVTGSIQRSLGNEECYAGTLAAAVDRLDDPAVSALHAQEQKQL